MTQRKNEKLRSHCLLTPEIQAKLIDAISRVLVYTQATALANIKKSTFKTWMAKGTKDEEEDLDTEYSRLSMAIKHARALKVEELLRDIAEGKNRWQSSAWMLERCFREDFGSDAGVIEDIKKKIEVLEKIIEPQQTK